MRSDPARPGAWLVAARAVVTPDAVLSPGWVEICGERIVDLGQGPPPRPPEHDLGAARLVPGFVDMHVHGGGGADLSCADPEQVARAVAWHRARGTTSLLASLVSAPPDQLLRQVRVLAELVADGAIDGIHLEGPWLAGDRCGAHDPASLRDPAPEEIDALLRAADGALTMVTLAPERPGGIDAVVRLHEAGVRVAIGHTSADPKLTRRAVDAGASIATHLFNAMPPLHHRRPGPALALLDDPRVTLEIVGDGQHVHPDLVAHVLASAGADRVALVTDAISAAGMPDGPHRLGGAQVQVTDGQARLPDGTLAGSTSSLLAMRTLLASLTDQVSLARVTASTAAAAVGLDDRGALRPGARADLVALAEDGHLQAVLRRGRWTPPADGA
ncbi:N-acetylglucosamine-6-phosphate deacetylase [Janibacter alkaliphilus]|uniref:N-acetylglucosamine-6-phosphate deacetylase n=1 Tax=Janibacter alkaliphilus TaxID=1069963 RepID=A0A852X5A7_9MICO|nr:N-acetylglucosamine-6-phosphate deacetylase [Janibacter alkaliphilus]NYG38089.1 N-acetylglucosamine-6-phosphate deacetylase [Janibacter alkaliphilus]